MDSLSPIQFGTALEGALFKQKVVGLGQRVNVDNLVLPQKAPEHQASDHINSYSCLSVC